MSQDFIEAEEYDIINVESKRIYLNLQFNKEVI